MTRSGSRQINKMVWSVLVCSRFNRKHTLQNFHFYLFPPAQEDNQWTSDFFITRLKHMAYNKFLFPLNVT